MKAIGFMLIGAALAAACTKTAPTSPTVVNTQTVADSVKLDSKATLQKVHLYFYDDDAFFNARTHIVGLDVTIAAATSPHTVLDAGQTGNQGDVTFWIPNSYSSIAVTNGTTGLDGTIQDCYVSTTANLDLPLRTREGWIFIHHSGDTYPNCR
jgi:hypothetical protein